MVRIALLLESSSRQFEILCENLKMEETGSNAEVGNDQDMCVICCGPVDPKSTGKINSCDHTFCYGCITRWFDNHERTCPLDRLVFSHINLYENGVLRSNHYDEFNVQQTIANSRVVHQFDPFVDVVQSYSHFIPYDALESFEITRQRRIFSQSINSNPVTINRSQSSSLSRVSPSYSTEVPASTVTPAISSMPGIPQNLRVQSNQPNDPVDVSTSPEFVPRALRLPRRYSDTIRMIQDLHI